MSAEGHDSKDAAVIDRRYSAIFSQLLCPGLDYSPLTGLTTVRLRNSNLMNELMLQNTSLQSYQPVRLPKYYLWRKMFNL
jgi:hypothetical protein